MNLTSSFVFKKKFEKILFLREVMDEIVFSSLIAFNGMLTSHSSNLSTHHYQLAIPSTPDHATIFLRCCHIFQEKRAALLYQRDRLRDNKEIVLTRIGLTRKGDPRKGCETWGWKRNNWIFLIYYSIHFFLSYLLFRIQFCSIFIIPFQVCHDQVTLVTSTLQFHQLCIQD